MRLDKLTSDMVPDKKPPTNLQDMYNDSEIMAEWEGFYESEEQHQKRMKEYHTDLKERGLLPSTAHRNNNTKHFE